MTKKPIKHPLPDVDWPSEQAAASGQWFRPITLNQVRANTRTWVPAMVPWRATESGLVTDNVLDWYGRFARGKPGVLVVEATGVRDIPSGPLLRIGHDRFIPGLQQLVQRVAEESEGETRLFIQTIDFLTVRRRPTKEAFFRRFLKVTHEHHSALGTSDDEEAREALVTTPEDRLQEVLSDREYQDYAYGYRESVNDTHLPQIAELPQVLPDIFAAAAQRAKTAGFDGVELHYAHAYTMAGFLSRTNERGDGYGATKEGRLRLPLEVLARCRESVGPDYCLGLRLLGDEVIDGGSRIEDAAYYSLELARAGADFISVSKGGKFEDARQPKVGDAVYPYTGPSGHECMPTVRSDERGPFGRNVSLAADIRKAIRGAELQTPVVTAGGIYSFEQAEQILAAGQADIVAAARQTLADPDWFLKIARGRGAEVRRCIFTNYCEGLDQKHKAVTCQLWDREFPDGFAGSTSPDGKRRLVAPEHPISARP